MIQPETIKNQFPIFTHHPNLVYLDNAATTQKPQSVIDGISNFYQKENANIHRGIYPLATQASQKYEQVREKVGQFIGANRPSNIIYTNGTTGGINLVANAFLAPRLEKGDEVLISAMEHHANLIPWQMVCKKKGAHLSVIPMNEQGELEMDQYKNMLSPRVKMIAVVQVSNTLGTINPIETLIELAHQQNIPVLVDGAQSVAHFPIDVEAMGADFFVFSGHKLFGPTGVGVLWGKEVHLEDMPPQYFGGDMIKNVTFEETIFADVPQRFEAGTPNIAGVIGLGYAIDFLNQFPKIAIQKHLKELTQYATDQLLSLNDLRIIGTATNKSAIISFALKNIHPHDVATFLGAENIAVRAGNHCTQPIMDFFNLSGTTRVSFTIYNTKADVDLLVEKLRGIQTFFT